MKNPDNIGLDQSSIAPHDFLRKAYQPIPPRAPGSQSELGISPRPKAAPFKPTYGLSREEWLEWGKSLKDRHEKALSFRASVAESRNLRYAGNRKVLPVLMAANPVVLGSFLTFNQAFSLFIDELRVAERIGILCHSALSATTIAIKQLCSILPGLA